MSDISFNTACKELKIAQIAQLDQLFQVAFSSYIRPLLLLGKSYANEQKCKQWRQQRFAHSLQIKRLWRNARDSLGNEKRRNSLTPVCAPNNVYCVG